MSELTLTLLRLGLLALLWIFIFGVVSVLRTDLYGTQVSRRTQRKARKQQEKAKEVAAKQVQPARSGPVGMGPVVATAPPVPSPIEAPRSRRGKGKRVPTTLVVTEGPLAGTSLPLRGSGVLIGRNPECALILDDDYASGRHCRIYQGGSGWMVEDLGSTNGTYLGRDKLSTPQPVGVGATLRIGQTVLELRG